MTILRLIVLLPLLALFGLLLFGIGCIFLIIETFTRKRYEVPLYSPTDPVAGNGDEPAASIPGPKCPHCNRFIERGKRCDCSESIDCTLCRLITLQPNAGSERRLRYSGQYHPDHHKH